MTLRPTMICSVFLFASLGALGCTRGYEPVTEDETPIEPERTAPASARPTPAARPTIAAAQPAAPLAASPTAPSAAGPAPTGAPLAGGLTWTAEAPLIARTPSMQMRAAEYAVAGEGAPEAVLSVFHFGPGMGGSVADNVARWVGQVHGENGAPAEARTARRVVNDLPVTMVEAEGTMSTGMPGGPAGPALAAGKLIGAIVEGPQGLVFFKLSGPAATVDRGRDAFEALVASIVPAG
jgi:hypothetical protein